MRHKSFLWLSRISESRSFFFFECSDGEGKVNLLIEVFFWSQVLRARSIEEHFYCTHSFQHIGDLIYDGGVKIGIRFYCFIHFCTIKEHFIQYSSRNGWFCTSCPLFGFHISIYFSIYATRQRVYWYRL